MVKTRKKSMDDAKARYEKFLESLRDDPDPEAKSILISIASTRAYIRRVNDESFECEYDPMAKAKELIKRLEGEPLPLNQDFDAYFPIAAAEIRHNFTNYDVLLYELDCRDFVYEGGKCGWEDIQESIDDKCMLMYRAYRIIKEQANELAGDLLEDWCERRSKSHDSIHGSV